MKDADKDKLSRGLKRELPEQQQLERDLDRLFGALEPPFAAQDRLASLLTQPTPFSESDLVLDGGVEEDIDRGPYSFEQALSQQENENQESDLLAAGLEEEPIQEDEKSLQPDPDEKGSTGKQ